MNDTPNLIGLRATCMEKVAAPLNSIARMLEVAAKNRHNKNITSKIINALEGTGPALPNTHRFRALGTIEPLTTHSTTPGWFLNKAWPDITRRIKINDPQKSLFDGNRQLVQAYRSNLKNTPTAVRPDRYLP